ncbi:MAG: hypothetical protein IJ985_05685, partial [Akkermansia sp.]|nr:hypothetical protein [Akkermansia sp.]
MYLAISGIPCRVRGIPLAFLGNQGRFVQKNAQCCPKRGAKSPNKPGIEDSKEQEMGFLGRFLTKNCIFFKNKLDV